MTCQPFLSWRIVAHLACPWSGQFGHIGPKYPNDTSKPPFLSLLGWPIGMRRSHAVCEGMIRRPVSSTCVANISDTSRPAMEMHRLLSRAIEPVSNSCRMMASANALFSLANALRAARTHIAKPILERRMIALLCLELRVKQAVKVPKNTPTSGCRVAP